MSSSNGKPKFSTVQPLQIDTKQEKTINQVEEPGSEEKSPTMRRIKFSGFSKVEQGYDCSTSPTIRSR